MIRNKQYDRDEYFNKLKELNFGSYSRREEAKKEFDRLIVRALHRYADIVKATGSSGNYIANAKQAVSCFNVYNVENIKYCLRVFNLKDSFDVSYHINSELVYEYTSGGGTSQKMLFSMFSLNVLRDVDYTDHCTSCSDLFGCIAVRNKRYCILNKEYKEDEYFSLRAKIVEHMREVPYVDSEGRRYSYGEFFPVDLSPFGYNETIAQEHFPLKRENAKEKGYRWRDREKMRYGAMVSSDRLPDHISEVQDSITEQTIACQHHENNEHPAQCEASCATAFKIVPLELQFYRSKGIPLPRACPNCRHFERLQKVVPLKLWHRQCQCAGKGSENKVYENTTTHQHGTTPCPNEFETSYAPERKEIVYCESCYNAEVV